MKTLDINWLAFLEDLELWLALDIEDRIELLNPRPLFGSGAIERLKSEFHDLVWTSRNPPSAQARMAVDRRCQDFLRVLKALELNRGVLKATREEFDGYVANYLTHAEKQSLNLGLGNPAASYREIYDDVAAESWVRRFLGGDGTWERPFLGPGQRAYFAHPAVLPAARRIVGDCYQEAQPISFDDLEARYADLNPEVMDAALLGTFRYLLLFPWLETDNREPIIGVWPGIIHRKLTSRKLPPEPVEPESSHGAPFLLDDMTAILVACAAEPLRLRASDSAVFATDQRKIAARLAELPRWFADTFVFDSEFRFRLARNFLSQLKFVETSSRYDAEYRLEATAAGIKWLGRRSDERLKHILDSLRGLDSNNFETEYDMPKGPTFLPVPVYIQGGGKLAEKVIPAVRGQYLEAPADSFVRLGDFCDYHAARNPILASTQHGVSGSLGSQYFHNANPETIERHWSSLLREFFRARLLPLGAAEAGYTTERAMCLRMTRLGKYLLGAEEEFQWAGEQGSLVIVQPNFEVVFLGPSPLAEAEISRFAERKGKQMGVMFTITKKSVFNGAAAGLTGKIILETLQRVCGKEIPANVSREVEGWARQIRRVEMWPATLVRCPDAETAMRIKAAVPGDFTKISDTVLELNGRVKPQEMARRLRAMGIFL